VRTEKWTIGLTEHLSFSMTLNDKYAIKNAGSNVINAPLIEMSIVVG